MCLLHVFQGAWVPLLPTHYPSLGRPLAPQWRADGPGTVGVSMITSLSPQQPNDLCTAFSTSQMKTGRSVKDLMYVAVDGRARLTSLLIVA